MEKAWHNHCESRRNLIRVAVQERYKFSGFLCAPCASLQGIALRPLPCNYNVLDFVCALSRR